MAKGKAPCHDGVPINFFQQLWPALGNGFYIMIRNNIELGVFHEGVTRGLISLIPKEGNNKEVNHTCYCNLQKKIAKTLHRRLQPILSDIISLEQMAFLPLKLFFAILC